MHKKSWQFFIHYKNINLNTIKAKIAQIQSDIIQKEKEIEKNLCAIENAKNSTTVTVEDLYITNNYIRDLYHKNNLLQEEIASLKKSLDEEKKQLARENGEKKVLNKLLEKVRKEQQKKVQEEENRVANESFLSQHYSTK